MTEQTPAVTVSHPPEGLLRAVNPALKFLLRTPLAGPARKQLMVLSFKGRKSGNAYSIPVSAHLIDNQLYALAGAAWTKNFRGGHPAEVLLNGKTTKMTGELIVGPAVVSDLSHRLPTPTASRRHSGRWGWPSANSEFPPSRSSRRRPNEKASSPSS